MPNDNAEAARLFTLQGYDVLDTPREAEFDAIARIVERCLRVPIVLVSLIDRNRQWFKARIGMERPETPRSMSFCTHALGNDDVMIVPDALDDERFASNPLVAASPFIRFYAGVALKAPNGIRIGTLCAIDTCPRRGLSADQTLTMTMLAGETIGALERRAGRA